MIIDDMGAMIGDAILMMHRVLKFEVQRATHDISMLIKIIT